jgi:antitoxin Phd
VRVELELRGAALLYKRQLNLYNGSMATMAVSEAREKLSEAVETARSEAVILERYGNPVAVLISPERYEELMEALEDAEDVAAFDEAMAEEGDNIPWEKVKADLGLS